MSLSEQFASATPPPVSRLDPNDPSAADVCSHAKPFGDAKASLYFRAIKKN
jgi:hypothetical protein